MGLDMYLSGKVFHASPRTKRDGFEVRETILELGYWRKHPNLHGYIVQNFAEGVDNCQPIELSAEDLTQILHATIDDKLPHTEGFFFGTSRPEDKEPTIKMLEKAIIWLSLGTPNEYKSVSYEASW